MVFKEENKIYIQQDVLWKDYEMSKGAAIGEFGCLLTSLTNILVLLGLDYTPLTLCQLLQANNGFDNQGNILWTVVNNLFGLSKVKYLPTDAINWSNIR